MWLNADQSTPLRVSVLDKGVYVTKLICISYASSIKSSSLTLLKVWFKVPDQFVQMQQTHPTSLSRCSRPAQPVCPDAADPPNQFVQMQQTHPTSLSRCSRPTKPVCPDADPPNQFVQMQTHSYIDNTTSCTHLDNQTLWR